MAKFHGRVAVADHQLGHLVGMIVKRFENQHFEHDHNIEEGTSGVEKSFLLANLIELITKSLPVDQRVQMRQKTVVLMNLFEPFLKDHKVSSPYRSSLR